MAPMFLLSCFLASASLWKSITCLSDAPCFGPRLEFFLMTKPGIEVKSQLVFWSAVGLRLYFKFLPQLQQMIPISEKASQSGHWCLADFSQSSKIMSLRNCSLCWCFSNISISFATFFCRRASCSFTVEIDIPSLRWSAVLLRVSAWLSASCCESHNDLASCTSGSCEQLCELASRTTGGLKITLSLW